ncbi:hypothetical protein [Rhodococcoides yunnanense]|uniref:hypothetical protein n=1 Tax=Rhodococcoides yunnanense TaxID=278209 RepID=UPI000A832EAC|nr:hypothetical protein [Rhodococcus yunnanensis]
MTSIGLRDPGSRVGRAGAKAVRRLRVWAAVLYVCCAVLYGIVGYVLASTYNLIDGDGPSRVANAGYTILSRDPHLGAIGFVWNPLPSLTEIPLLLFTPLWPELKTLGLAGVVQSALFMAAAVVVIRRIALDRGVPTGWRWLAVATFALNPMIIEYGATGLSEAAFIFFVAIAVRRLLLWTSRSGPATGSTARDVVDLALAGFALGASYLVRYEAVAVVAAAVGTVFLVTWLRYRRHVDRRQALGTAFHDGFIVGFPGAAAFVFWAIAGWVLTGEALSQITSQYGNGSQVSVAADLQGGSVVDPDVAGEVVVSRILGMQPLLIVVLAAALVVAHRQRRLDALVPIALFGIAVVFQAAAQVTGATFGWFRFYIFVVPLVVITVLTWWLPGAERRGSGSAMSRHLPGLAMFAVAVTSIPVTWMSMLNPAVGNQSVQYGLQSIVSPSTHPPDQQYYFQLFQDDRAIAEWLDRQNLPEGSVLSDTFQSWGIWLASERPDQFVITSDLDFFTVLNDPGDNGIRYILVSDPGANGAIDAINTRYPSIWEDGAGLGSRVISVVGPEASARWRVFSVYSAE